MTVSQPVAWGRVWHRTRQAQYGLNGSWLYRLLTRFLQELEHAARRPVGDGSLSLHLVLPHRIPSGDLVFGLDQNQSGLVQKLENLLCLPFIQLFADLQLWKHARTHTHKQREKFLITRCAFNLSEKIFFNSYTVPGVEAMVLLNNLQSCKTKHKMDRAASQLWASFEMKRQQEACREQKREVESVLRALTTNHASSTPSDNQSQQRIPHHVRGKMLHHQTFTITFFFSSGVYPQTTPIFSLTGRLIFLKSHQEETIHRVTEFD